MKVKICFIHIPKCGGRSIKYALSYVDHDKEWQQVGWFAGHPTIHQMREMSNGRIDEADIKFAVVRNTWDIRWSWYWFARNGGPLQQHEGQENCKSVGFRDHIRWLEKAVTEGIGNESRYGTTTSNLFNQPQLDYIEEGVRIIKFDRMKEEFKEMFGVPMTAHIGKESPDTSFRDAYDDETKEIVGRLFHKDIEKFGFQFNEEK